MAGQAVMLSQSDLAAENVYLFEDLTSTPFIVHFPWVTAVCKKFVLYLYRPHSGCGGGGGGGGQCSFYK